MQAHAHGVGGVASVAQRDVCAAGFPDELRGAANAVMLDLPTPALAVPHALAALMPGPLCGLLNLSSPLLSQSLVSANLTPFHSLILLVSPVQYSVLLTCTLHYTRSGLIT